jgi:hypothetical protein
MRTSPRGTLFFALAALVGACADQRHPVAPSFSLLSGATACPTPANVVVHDEASLLAALSTAFQGEVIGLDGFFGISADVTIATPGVALTCATPGSGLFATPGAGVQELLIVAAKKVVVDRLRLDDSQGGDTPLVAINDGVTFFAESLRFTNNTVTCGPGGCVFIGGGAGPVVTDNHFQSAGSFTGVQLQTNGPDNSIRIDGARVERNTVVATAPSTGFAFLGGIRPFNASNVVIADNTVIGPWVNALSLTRVAQSRIEGNHLQGAAVYGIRMGGSLPFIPPGRVSENALSNNVVRAAGTAGVFAGLACDNVFVGNNLQGDAGNIGLIFPVSSGGNTFVGNGTIVVDDGAFDCDGDGVNDPNIITGAGAVMHGAIFDDVVSNAVRTIHGITLH